MATVQAATVIAPLPPRPALPDWIEAYRARLDELSAAAPEQLRTALVATLLARDRVARELTLAPGQLSPAQLLALGDLDVRLRSLAERVERVLGVGGIRLLALSGGADKQGWWWKLDEHLPPARALWTIVSALLFAGAVSLIAEIARRFFSEGPDFTGALYTLVQAGLTLLAGSTLLGTGGNAFEKWLDRHDVRRRLHPLIKTALAAMAFLVVLTGFGLLPRVAGSYNKAGVARDAQGNVGMAIQDFKRALSLSPQLPQARYNLGRAYEKVPDDDSAAIEYQKAIQTEPGLYPAYNSLARHYILRKGDSSAALGLIDAALLLTSQDRTREAGDVQRVQFSLLKNRGWANLVAENYAQAKADLSAALELDPARASAHCLLAQVHEKLSQPAISDWELCLGLSAGATDVESLWLATAQDRVLRATEDVK